MKKLLAIAALLLASTAAQAQYTFDYGGRTIRIDPDRGTVQIPGVYDNTAERPNARATMTIIATTIATGRANGRRKTPEDRPADRRPTSGSRSTCPGRTGCRACRARARSRGARASHDCAGGAFDRHCRRCPGGAGDDAGSAAAAQRACAASSAGAAARAEPSVAAVTPAPARHRRLRKPQTRRLASG